MSQLRPPLCPNKSCEVLMCHDEQEYFKIPSSFVCVGKLQQEFKYKDLKGYNDYIYCLYGPIIKEVVRFNLTKEVALAIRDLMDTIIRDGL